MEFKFTNQAFGLCANPSIHEPDQLFFTLREYYCINERIAEDSAEIQVLEARIGEEVFPNDEKYRKAEYRIWYAYSIAGLDSVIFLIAPDPVRAHYGFLMDFIYSIKEDKLYFIWNLDKDKVNTIIGPLSARVGPNYIFDSDILKYCRFCSILVNGPVPIRFISSIEELLLEAVFYDEAIFHLDPDSNSQMHFFPDSDVNKWNNIRLGLPTIQRSGDKIDVAYFMAKFDKIYKINLTIKNLIVVDYKQEEIDKTLKWYGDRPNY